MHIFSSFGYILYLEKNTAVQTWIGPDIYNFDFMFMKLRLGR
jgi:hypothetical protein